VKHVASHGNAVAMWHFSLNWSHSTASDDVESTTFTTSLLADRLVHSNETWSCTLMLQKSDEKRACVRTEHFPDAG
jgi:hypothetical protein